MPSVITIGNFDGVHLGHRAILAKAREVADRLGGQVVAMPFARHVATLLRPGTQPPPISTLTQRKQLLLESGADVVEPIEPTLELLAETPEEFLRLLREHHQLLGVVEGPDFRFGHRRAGDMALLAEIGQREGFEVHTVQPIVATLTNQLQVTVSSTLVRWLIGKGRVLDAAYCLRRPYELHGPVTQGEQRGRTIGVPTANLELATIDQVLIPANGVYAGMAVLADARRYPAAISVGVKPTFGDKQLTVEAHLLDFKADLYGQPLTLQFHRWIREQMPFAGVDALKAQLSRDIDETRRLVQRRVIAAHGGPPGAEAESACRH